MTEKKYILIADDDEDDVQLFSEAVEAFDSSITCHAATNGEEALDVLRKHIEKPVFVFLDINMPVMGGWDCLQEIRKSNSQLPVFIYSTSTLKHDVRESLSLGATGFITKPSDFHDIRRLVDQLCRRYISDSRSDVPLKIEGVINAL